jgi:cytochrome c oxidase subunit 2
MFADIPLFPEQASTHAARVDGLLFFLLAVSAFFSMAIAATLIHFAVKYRRRSESDRPPPTENSLKLELTWTLIPLAIALFIFVWGARLYLSWARAPEDALEIYVVAKQWMWKVQHLGGEREINQLHVPLGRPVKLTLISQDVIHSFFVPAFRIHQDVLPNRYTTVWFEPTKTGVHHLFCSQYCGTNHAKMVGQVVVMSPEDYQAWLTHDADGSMANKGRQLFQKLQCVTCHSANSGARGPLLENLYGRDVYLQDGQVVRADESYLRESILDPDAKIVEPFKSIMPSFKGQVSEEEILELVTFLKGLRRGQTPPRVEDADPPAINRGNGPGTIPGLKTRTEK